MNSGFRIFVIAMVSAICVILLAASYYSWAMADFDCVDGYMECRRNWWTDAGLVAGGSVIVWLVTLIWFFRSRKSSR